MSIAKEIYVNHANHVHRDDATQINAVMAFFCRWSCEGIHVFNVFVEIEERLNGNRLLVSSEEALEGKLFVHFIGLFLLSYIKKQMQEHKMFGKYTMSSLLDELDMIELIHIPGKAPIVREVLNKQIQIYEKMAVPPPAGSLS